MGDLGKKPPYWKTRRPWGRGCPIIAHVVHTQSRDHGSLHKPCKNMESVQLQVMSFFEIRTIFRGKCAQFPKSPASHPAYLIAFVPDVGAKRPPTAAIAKIQRLYLRNLWIAIPHESQRSHKQLTEKAIFSCIQHVLNNYACLFQLWVKFKWNSLLYCASVLVA